MYKKIIIQLLLLVLLFGIIITVFLLYFDEEKKPNNTNLTTTKIIESEIDDKTGTLIKDINYSFSDLSGNYYEIISDLGKIDINNSDKIHMTNVRAKIYLKNSPPISITSKYAYYSKINHDTNFFDNILLSHLVHKVTSENLDVSFSNNMISMYNNIIYKKPGTQLNADRLEIDLITKNTKIFMDNKSEKIKIVNNK
tara:strand:+ start:350 stop:940 length:591 start_codon:yes stop_codon:yes gene_type:complete